MFAHHNTHVRRARAEAVVNEASVAAHDPCDLHQGACTRYPFCNKCAVPLAQVERVQPSTVTPHSLGY